MNWPRWLVRHGPQHALGEVAIAAEGQPTLRITLDSDGLTFHMDEDGRLRSWNIGLGKFLFPASGHAGCVRGGAGEVSGEAAMNRTKIPYADWTWSPVTGCTFGCEWCYAQGIAKRFGRSVPTLSGKAFDARPEDGPFPAGFFPTIYPHRLDEPLKVKKPSTIFVCSAGDLFGPEVPDSFRNEVWWQMARQGRHRFLVLTKRADAMQRFVSEQDSDAWMESGPWPLPNLILGVTVTCQADADERIPILLDTPRRSDG